MAPGDVHGGDRDLQQPGHLGGHLAHAAARQHDLDQPPVGVLGAGQDGCLPVEDVGEHLVEDVVEPNVVGEDDQREAQPVGLLDHLGGQFVEVAAQLDGERRQPAFVKIRHKAAQRLGSVPERVAGREQQLVRLHPRQDVGDLHDVEALHDAVEPALPGDEPRPREGRHAQDLSDGHSVNDRSGACESHRGCRGIRRHGALRGICAFSTNCA